MLFNILRKLAKNCDIIQISNNKQNDPFFDWICGRCQRKRYCCTFRLGCCWWSNSLKSRRYFKNRVASQPNWLQYDIEKVVVIRDNHRHQFFFRNNEAMAQQLRCQIQLPLKNIPPSFLPNLSLRLQTVQTSLLKPSSLYISFSGNLVKYQKIYDFRGNRSQFAWNNLKLVFKF